MPTGRIIKPLLVFVIGSTCIITKSVSAQKTSSVPDCVAERFEGTAKLIKNAAIAVSPIELPPLANGRGGPGNDGTCPQETVTFSSHPFVSGPGFIAQQGMVNTEIAAVTYTIPAIAFPIQIDRIDVLVGTTSLSSQITLQWSVLVWEGEPHTGNLVYEIVSDGTNPPHVVASPPTNSVHIQASVDPGDPDQIIVTNNGTNKFSVGVRIDQHNLSPTSSCPCIPSFPPAGTLPAFCCPPAANSNMFPTVDLDGLSQPSQNWLWARACPGATGVCVTDGGWFTTGSLGISGDWNLRAAYTPAGCIVPTGACCIPNGSCLGDLTSAQCAAQGGTYQGNNTLCSSINCPVPTGACCLGNGNCTLESFNNCTALGGTYMGTNTLCGANTCRGACCVPATQQCVFTTQANCTAANGFFQGLGTNCQTTACFGACCLPNGNCVGGVMPSNCTAQGGVFQGANTTCGTVNCPPPLGACCLGTTCIPNETQADCVGGFGGTWQGALSTCSPDPCSGPPPCPADLNGDTSVNVSDLLSVISGWGPCSQPCPPHCNPDINDDCFVNVSDLLSVISNWGPCD